jgi:hypothetical protein
VAVYARVLFALDIVRAVPGLKFTPGIAVDYTIQVVIRTAILDENTSVRADIGYLDG